jgi:hypothetical protein
MSVVVSGGTSRQNFASTTTRYHENSNLLHENSNLLQENALASGPIYKYDGRRLSFLSNRPSPTDCRIFKQISAVA